jgi:uracil-DNA glycosylase family 4
MRISTTLYALAVQQLISGACKAAGLQPGNGAVEGVVGLLTRHFSDDSTRLTEALELTNERAWRALEVALAGDSLWDRCKLLMARGEDKAFREQVRPFLDACPLVELQGKGPYRQACLRELQAARKSGLLQAGKLEPAALARQAGAFARFTEPQGLLQAEGMALGEMGDELRQAGHANLAAFISLRPQQGDPLLVLAARYFFRRAVEDDSALFQGLAFAQMEKLQQGQENAFQGLHQALCEQAQRLEQLLGDIQVTVQETHEAVLDIREEQQRQGAQHRDLYQAVLDLQSRLDLMHTELRPHDSLSIRTDAERLLVKQLVIRYRQLAEDSRQELPALLNAISKLEVAAGDFQAAQKDFAAVAQLVGDPKAQAEAHANAYHTALERRDWPTALVELREAIRLDRARFAPFPVEKFQPQRILGAGGFGVAFLCKHKYLNAEVVVKTLLGDDLDRGIDQVFAEAQTLRQLDHPAIIRLQDCGFASPNESKPYLVMDYFEGATLEEQARQAPLSTEEVVSVAQQVASGLQAAHSKSILHRDVKPANLLVRKPVAGSAWQVKLIDFGLALRRTGRETMLATSATLTGSSIAGTLDYAAPEQMGKLHGVSVGPTSDVYGFARTCCYALFQTPQPLLRHWRSIPAELAELLESCLEEKPDHRPRDFQTVLERLTALAPPAAKPRGQKVALPVSPPEVTAPSPVGAGSPDPATRMPVADMTPEQRRQELEALAQQVSGCTRCSVLAGSRTQTVFGAGPLDPEICFLGEAPGGDEDRVGEPFIGAAGQVLNELLQTAGLRREEVYVSNLLKCRPPGNRTPLPAEIGNCRGYLQRQLELLRPKYICTLGGCASQNLLGSTQTIGKLRGRFHDYRGIPVLCTYHPAFLLPGRSPEKKRDVLEDLQLLLRRMGRAPARK